MNKKEFGITLIALVITIVVLLILAGISLNITIGKNGILEKSKESKEKTEIAREKEILDLAMTDAKLTGDFSRDNLEKSIKIYENNINVTEDDENYIIEYNNSKRVYKVNKDNNLNIDSDIEDEKLNYAKNGLVIWYDAIDNTRAGHDNNATKWENLSEEGAKYDANLMNFNFNDNSGWTDNSIILDGINDWIQMSYINFGNDFTIEIVAKPLDVNTAKQQIYISNFEEGGFGIRKVNNHNEIYTYIGDGYKKVSSTDLMNLNQIYSMSLSYNGNNLSFRENGKSYNMDITSNYKNPELSTIIALGTNPDGNTNEELDYEAYFNCEIYSVRIYNHCLTDEEIKNNYRMDEKRFGITNITKVPEDIGYVKDGLICLYDGKQNTLSGHSYKNPNWSNLVSTTNENATLVNFDYNATSGWTDNSLIIDGINDWVKMSYMYSENMTIEIVAKPLNITTNQQNYICNFQTGGIGIGNEGDGRNSGRAYIGSNYVCIESDKDTEIGKKYSLSTGYDNSKLFFRENDNIKTVQITGKSKGPTNNTVFAIGTNPNGEKDELPSNEDRIKMEIYSVRIYNRCLTEAEVNANYNIDKQRFNIN